MDSRLLSFLQLVVKAARCLITSERGQTGTEVAVICVVCTTCALGGVILTTGDEAAAEIESVFHAGITQASGTLLVNGSVLATASGDPITTEALIVTLGTVGKPAPVVLDGSVEGERLVLAFASETAFDNDVPYTAEELRGDGDGVLEPGETAEVRVNVADIGDGTVALGPTDDWTLRISAPSGGQLEVSRTMPFALQAVNSLR